MKKMIASSMITIALFGSVAASAAFAAPCIQKGGTKITVNNANYFWGIQSSSSYVSTGGNLALGNIGGGNITPGPATATTNMSMTNVNSNSTTVTTTSTGATNNVSLTNTGSFVSVCAGAAN